MSEPLIMIAAPVRNRAWILGDYLEHIHNLDYPKKKISLRFVINDSTDESDQILVQFKKDYAHEYRDITLYRVTLGAKEDGRTKRREKGIFSNLAILRNTTIDLLDGEEYMMSCDTDILMAPDTLKKLLSHEKLLISAIVKNSPNNHYNVMAWVEDPKTKQPTEIAMHIPEPQFGDLIKVGVMGACALYHKNVLATCKFKDHQQGEDLGFCLEAKKYGYELFCDTTRGLATHVMDKISWIENRTLNYNWSKNKQA